MADMNRGLDLSKVGGFSFFVSYAMSGYAAGVRYLAPLKMGERDAGN